MVESRSRDGLSEHSRFRAVRVPLAYISLHAPARGGGLSYTKRHARTHGHETLRERGSEGEG